MVRRWYQLSMINGNEINSEGGIEADIKSLCWAPGLGWYHRVLFVLSDVGARDGQPGADRGWGGSRRGAWTRVEELSTASVA